MATLISAKPVPNNNAHKAYRYLERVGISSKVTKDGITTFEMIIPKDLKNDHEKAMEVIKAALGYNPDNWEFKHTEFQIV
ncbi:putative chaperone protein [Ochrobactrum phage vB_OspM_OC]|nr:putative chaperone protein [Ochrobactrum phage vB_OspM_OC]